MGSKSRQAKKGHAKTSQNKTRQKQDIAVITHKKTQKAKKDACAALGMFFKKRQKHTRRDS
jgi:hypothetical protein